MRADYFPADRCALADVILALGRRNPLRPGMKTGNGQQAKSE
jgi:hypothetical protein